MAKKSKTIAEKKKKSSRYNKTPEMPKEPTESGGLGAFRPGVGGAWSAPVGKRRTRIIEDKEKDRTMSDNYGDSTYVKPRQDSNLKTKPLQKRRAAETKNITKIGPY